MTATRELFQEHHTSFMKNVVKDLEDHNVVCSTMGQRKHKNLSTYVLGGYQRQASISLVEYYNYRLCKWIKCTEMSTPRSGVTCCVLYLYIYAIGGRNNSLNGNKDCADVEAFDTFTNSWKKRSFLNVPRSRAG